MKIEARNFRTHIDLQSLHTFIVDCWRTQGPNVTFHVGDLHWRLRPQPGKSPERDIRLWYYDQALLAFAWFDPPNSGDLQCHPHSDKALLEPMLLTWLEQQAKEQGFLDFTVGVFSNDTQRERLLKRRGYCPQSSALCHMLRSLSTPITAVPLPQGYSIHCAAPEDLDSLATTVALAFGSPPKPTSAYLSVRAGWAYHNTLDLVVRCDRGQVVAFCLAWLDENNHVGLLEPVGCHPEHQCRGLASALIATVLETLRQAGASRTVVYPNSEDFAACRLYTKCGFRLVANDYDWQLTF